MRKAFTLIEVMISIIILSILMIFLYRSYADLNNSNTRLQKQVQKIQKFEKIKKTLYLDLSVAMKSSVKILNQSKREDVVFMQTKHSVHKRINPYVAYIVKEKKLYRLESLKPFKEYPLTADSEFVADELGEVKTFRLYRSKDPKNEVYLIDLDFKEDKEIVLKVKLLNSL